MLSVILDKGDESITRTILLSSRKGGEGKSLISYNLTCYLARHHHKCLFIDLDSQCDSTACFKSLSKDEKEKSSMYRAYVHDGKDIRAPFPKDFHPVKVNDYIDVMASDPKMSLAGNLMSTNPSMTNYVILHVFSALKLTKRDYDYIIIDTHNSILGTPTTIGAMIVANIILSPVTPSVFGVKAVSDMTNAINDLESKLISPVTQQPILDPKLYFIANLVKHNTASSHDFQEVVKSNPNFIAMIDERELLNRATNQLESVFKLVDNEKNKLVYNKKHNKRSTKRDIHRYQNDSKVLTTNVIPSFNNIYNVIKKG